MGENNTTEPFAHKPVYCRRTDLECETPNACVGGGYCRFGLDPEHQRVSTKTTAGPWVQFIDRSAGVIEIVPAMRHGVIATVKLADNGDANAHLIGAAPDLLTTCKSLVAEIAKYHRRFDARLFVTAERAIAKAEGKSE